MSKLFRLTLYQRYWHNWRGISFILCALSLAMLWLAPDLVRAYRDALTLAAGLGALTFVLGYAMGHMAFVAIGKQGITVQLPLWRVHIPFEQIYATRVATLGGAAPGQWKDVDVARLNALAIELRAWPQPVRVLRFWLGRLVLSNALVLPVDDVVSLGRAVDAGVAQVRERRQAPKAG